MPNRMVIRFTMREVTLFLGKNDCISLLPFSLLKRLAKILDVRRPLSNDYRLLADHFRLPREDIDHLAVELYEKPHGSPFLRLVGELVRRKVVVGKLIEPLQEIGHDELAKEVEEHADVGYHVNLFFSRIFTLSCV